MNIKLIATDLDDTLLRRDKTISDYTKSVFERCRELGVLTAFATARSRENTLELQEQLRPNGNIVTGGCLIYVGGELLRSYYMPEAPASALLAELVSIPNVKRVSARTIDASFSNQPYEHRTLVDFFTPVGVPLLHCSYHSDDDELMRTLAAKYPELDFKHVSNTDLYDVNPNGATKFNGVRTLAEHFGVAISEVAAFGDDYNDIEMLKNCGIGVAVENAIDDCKAVADYTALDCDADGVAHWIEEYILNGN
ncbi:MAG: Cof-type HAD-IIB family hydrolase [Oscillospiraceae bacterium]|jgi:HAD superfamily hydrolase (TIGR01484 family)|nr:Cof-type HAD-IIB family hydrolase [Oscillospiraceae bacterium]